MAGRNDNLAYEYPEYDEQYLAYDEYDDAKQRKPRIEHSTNKNKKASRLSLIEVATPAIAAVILLAGVISNQIEVSRLTTEQSKLNSQLAQIQSDCANLETQLAAKTGITAVEDYAENTLGLTKLDKSQVEFVEIPAPTVSEVIAQEETGFFSSLKDWMSGIKEYLGIE